MLSVRGWRDGWARFQTCSRRFWAVVQFTVLSTAVTWRKAREPQQLYCLLSRLASRSLHWYREGVFVLFFVAKHQRLSAVSPVSTSRRAKCWLLTKTSALTFLRRHSRIFHEWSITSVAVNTVRCREFYTFRRLEVTTARFPLPFWHERSQRSGWGSPFKQQWGVVRKMEYILKWRKLSIHVSSDLESTHTSFLLVDLHFKACGIKHTADIGINYRDFLLFWYII